MIKVINILFILVLFIGNSSIAQNLVPNPSFEDTTYSCPITIGIASNLNHCKDWYGANGTSSDYYNSCSNSAAGVPNNMTGYQLARTGEAYCGIVTNRIDTTNIGEWNEYIGVYLKTPLSINQEYEFKMYVNLADKSKHTIDKIGALFSNNALHPFNFGGVIPFSTQVENYYGNVIHDKQNWKEIKQTFIADSSYQVLTIGNFYSSYNTNMYDTYSNSGWNPTDIPYILIDDVSLTPINTICLGDSISLTSLGDTLYGWANSLNPNVIISTDSIITVSPSSNTIFYDYSNGDTTEFIVNVMNNGVFNLPNDTNLCRGQTLLLNAATSNSTYLWQDNSTNYKYEVTQPSTYWVQVTNSCGVFTDTINVTYDTIPVNIGNDTILCYGESLTLNPQITNSTYLWQNFSTNPSFTIQPWINQPNIYWVQVTNSNGCGADTIYVSYLDDYNSSFLMNDTTFCEEDTISIKASIPISNYLWSTGSTDSTITVSVPGQYWLEISNKCYTDYDTVNVSMTPKPIYQLDNEIILCEGDTISLSVNSSENIAYWWDNYNIPTFNPILNVYNEGTYYVTIHKQGCYYKDSVIVTTKKCDIDLTIPNVFTPNQDGINDFLIIATENVKDYAIAIYNRWGQLIFESNDKTYHWNGTFKDNKCSSGTYFYIIEVSNEYESKTYKGTLSLMR